MCPISSGRPSRPASFSRVFSQPVSTTSAARTQAAAALFLPGSFMRRRILSPDDLRARAEARRPQRLVAGDRRARERLLRTLLEDHAQPLQSDLQLAARPAGGAELRLEVL